MVSTRALGLALAMVACKASAGFTGSATLISDYDYRGISQTAGDTALQASLAYAHDSGWYATAWGSSLDWGPDSEAKVEVDYTAGITRAIGESGLSWDLGVLAYTYPGLSPANFVEFYGGLSYAGLRIKLSYSDDFAGVGESGWYADGGYTYKWENGFSFLLYSGYSFGDAFDPVDEHLGPAIGFPDYWNYGIGAGYSLGDHLYLEIKAVGTDFGASHREDHGVFENDLRGIAGVTLLFP